MISTIIIGLVCGLATWDLFYSKPKGVSVSNENPDSKAIQTLQFIGIFFGVAILALVAMFLLFLLLNNRVIYLIAVVIAWLVLRNVRNKRGGIWK